MTVTVGFIGTGNMGGAIAIGLREQDVRLVGFDPDAAKLESLDTRCGLTPLAEAEDVVEQSDYVVLAVKPQMAERVLNGLAPLFDEDTCLLSIAAGLTTEKLKTWSGGRCPVVRVMPNTPALVGAGVFALCLGDPGLSQAQKADIQKLFAAQGQVHVLEERLFDAFTAVVGSGPAYVFYIMESLIDAAVALGIPRDGATDMVRGLFSGSVKLAEESEHSLSQLREMVCSPGGSTIVAVNHFDSRAVKGALIEGVKAACQRNRELGG